MSETDFRRRPDATSYGWVWLIGAVLLAMIIWWIVVWAAAPGQQSAVAPTRAAPVAAARPAPGTAPAGTPRERVAGSRQQFSTSHNPPTARP